MKASLPDAGLFTVSAAHLPRSWGVELGFVSQPQGLGSCSRPPRPA